tara:strand:+ start:604 stop:1389 length:786 start_codon:yes stop_codon:yes gene_type:complete
MRTTGKSGFKMRSGNKPSGFKMMGSSPARQMTDFSNVTVDGEDAKTVSERNIKERNNRKKEKEKEMQDLLDNPDQSINPDKHRKENMMPPPAKQRDWTKTQTSSSPAISPYKNAEYDAAIAKDPNLNKHIAERNKHQKGSAEYEAQQAKINDAYGKVRNQTTLKRDQDNLETPDAKETNVTETPADGVVEAVTEVEDPKAKPKETSNKLGNVLAGAFTGGLDAVYGTGKVLKGGGDVIFKKPKKEKSLSDVEKEVDDKIDS